MPRARYDQGDVVMGRWPGSTLYYEVRVLSFDAETQLYTVIYKDGTELELRESDIKSSTTFKASGRSRSRSRSPGRRRSRSRSPARTTRRSSSRRSSSRNTEKKQEKLKEVLEVRLTPMKVTPTDNNGNTTGVKLETFKPDTPPEAAVEPEQAGGGRYNLRRRKLADAKPNDEKVESEDVPVTPDAPVAPAKGAEMEFGGRIGTILLLPFLPCVVFFVLVKLALDDVNLLDPLPALPPLEALWDWHVFGIVLAWLAFQAILAILPVGKVVDGMPLATGKTLKYRINGFYALLVTAAAVGVAMQQEVDLTFIHTHILQFFSAAALVSLVLSVYLYVSSRNTPVEERSASGNAGYLIYDFFMGRELNPRLKSFDIKFYCELRPGLMGWLLINLSMALAEMKVQKLEIPSTAMLMVNIFQLIWVADGLWHEEKLLSMMDMTHDGFGFMLAFGDLVWVPFTFTCQAHYLVSHPNQLSHLAIACAILLQVLGYYIFRKSNSQKHNFRRNPADPAFSKVKTIPTATGKSLLASGLWGVVRHPNYLGDLLMGVAWTIPCGFEHVLPNFYLIYLVLLLLHRISRDDRLCRKKYGSAWEEYRKAVPYRIIPRIF